METDDEQTRISWQEIVLPDFDTSHVVERPGSPVYCLGSDDGRIGLLSADGLEDVGPVSITDSGEAINGIAFSEGLIAVSTRDELILTNTGTKIEGLFDRLVFPIGSHGVASRPGGGFVATMGRNGLVLMGRNRDLSYSVHAWKPAGTPINAYKVVSVFDPVRGEVLACASRGIGLIGLPVARDGSLGTGARILRPNGVDFVDVTSLGSREYPYAVIALGLDCSIHFVRDPSTGGKAKHLHMAETGERGYRILSAKGHIFLLTSKQLTIIPNLASQLLEGEEIELPLTARKLEVEAVDMTVTSDGFVLIVMPNSIRRVEIAKLVAGFERSESISPVSSEIFDQQVDPSSQATEECLTPFDDSIWSPSELVPMS